MKSFSFDRLVEWKALRKAKPFPGLPSLSRRANPQVLTDLVVASSFQSRTIFAFRRSTGLCVWRSELNAYGGTSPSHIRDVIFFSTSRGVFALSAKDGQKRWSYEPYPDSSEMFYTDPMYSENTVFVGDRHGYLHALDAKRGLLRWKAHVGSFDHDSINATVAISKGKVYSVSVGGKLSCVSAKSGKIVWTISLPDGGVRPPIVYAGRIFVQSKRSVFLVHIKTKKIVQLSFQNVADICVRRRSLYILEDVGAGDDFGSDRFRVSVYTRSHLTKLFHIQGYMSSFFETNNTKQLGILGSNKMIFYDLEKGSREIEILGPFSSMPFLDKKFIYFIDLLNEVVCIRRPI